MITLKIKYSTDSNSYKTIFEYQRQYSILLRLFYNRRKEGLQETEIKHLQYVITFNKNSKFYFRIKY